MTHPTVPVAILIVCLMIYCIAVGLMFRKDNMGFRRRWLPLDYIWVPLGGLTVLSLLALWWHMR
ncbi:MAG TPA: hypothetical protein VMR33_10700 [Candidatus Baltobacteraceae bacterium]|jgi:hypothetical protein|nr:hypothetical protein [Candidatus Baltobacteraceae bacterium]